MIKKMISGWNAAPGAPKGWDPTVHGECGALPVRVFPPAAARNPSLAHYCESAWEPTPTELEWLTQGGTVVLRVVGWQIPVALYCEAPSEDEAVGRGETVLELAARQLAECRHILAHALNALNGAEFFLAPEDPKTWPQKLTDTAIALGHVSFDALHHAPKCPANHFHKTRMPTGHCRCGAQRDADKAKQA
jgi:hypothetical protein